jgi:hypothetical protein
MVLTKCYIDPSKLTAVIFLNKKQPLKNPTKRVGLVQIEPLHHLIEN